MMGKFDIEKFIQLIQLNQLVLCLNYKLIKKKLLNDQERMLL